MHDFDEIVLSKEELRVLRRLTKEDLPLSDDIRPVFSRLHHHGFTRVYFDTPADQQMVQIKDEGKDYLAYLRKQRSKAKQGAAHDCIVAIIGAAAGTGMTILVEHFSAIVSFIRSCFQ